MASDASLVPDDTRLLITATVPAATDLGCQIVACAARAVHIVALEHKTLGTLYASMPLCDACAQRLGARRRAAR